MANTTQQIEILNHFENMTAILYISGLLITDLEELKGNKFVVRVEDSRSFRVSVNEITIVPVS